MGVEHGPGQQDDFQPNEPQDVGGDKLGASGEVVEHRFDLTAWFESGYPPTVQETEDPDEYEAGRQTAKTFIQAFYDQPWKRRSTNPFFHKTAREVNRLNKLYPGLREEVYLEGKLKIALRFKQEHPDLFDEVDQQELDDLRSRLGLTSE